MEIGTQYKPDNKFKAAARLHQSKYRAEVLRVDYEEYGNRLNDEDARRLLNYYEKLNSRAILRNLYPSYSKKRDGDMLRSEHIPFNLLAPLVTNQTNAIEIIRRAFGIDCVAVDFVGIEYAPIPRNQYLRDGTAFDTYIEVATPSEKIGIGIEVKYTEQDYPIGKTEKTNVENHKSPYWVTARASDCFNNPDDKIFGSDPLRQLWRNHLLGLSMVQHEDIDHFFSITLFPNGNEHFHEVLPRYIALLRDEKKRYVFGCTFEKYIASIAGTSEFTEWRNWLERRYVVNF
ncbi:MAG: PGN_0703 family putative restriction endonuclease [Candidatus Thorarchaeota archaeon]